MQPTTVRSQPSVEATSEVSEAAVGLPGSRGPGLLRGWREFAGREWKPATALLSVFALFYFFPAASTRVNEAVSESLALTRWYAREHVLLCLVPAFFIAGAIAAFVSQGAVMKYLGSTAHQVLAYTVASVSGTILAVCSCTVLPLFAGIYKRGAGLGPATAFLYSGPAINALAIILTARVLGLELGVARAVGAVTFSVVIGLLMAFIFRNESVEKARAAMVYPAEESRPLWKTGVYFAAMLAILIFVNWGAPQGDSGLWSTIYHARWLITAVFGLLLAVVLVVWFGLPVRQTALAAAPAVVLGFAFPGLPLLAFVAAVAGLTVIIGTRRDEMGAWFDATWDFAKQILPLLLIGVLVAGFLLGRPGHEGLIPSSWVSAAVGGNSLRSNLFASVAGAFMYFATLTEVPILQGLLGNGMGKGPALALLLAGPALSLPNMLVIRSVIGTRKTVVYVSLVTVMATISGLAFGVFF